MKATLTGAALGILLVAAGACGTFGYDPEDPVTIRTQAPANLNFYGGQAHALDLYIYRVHEPTSFQASPPAKLAALSDEVRGGSPLGRWTVNPGMMTRLEIGPMEEDRYEWVGVFAAYREPRGNLIATAAIPTDGKLKLVLDSNGIVKFVED